MVSSCVLNFVLAWKTSANRDAGAQFLKFKHAEVDLSDCIIWNLNKMLIQRSWNNHQRKEIILKTTKIKTNRMSSARAWMNISKSPRHNPSGQGRPTCVHCLALCPNNPQTKQGFFLFSIWQFAATWPSSPQLKQVANKVSPGSKYLGIRWS
jgi:hypothetical protein